MNSDAKTAWKSFVEEIEVSGKHLLDEINGGAVNGHAFEWECHGVLQWAS